MSAQFHELLEATIDHLQLLQANGARFVPVETETLRALSDGSGGAQAPTASPAPGMTPPTRQAPVSGPSGTAPTLPTPLVSATPGDPAPQDPPLDSPKAQAFAELRARAVQCMKCAHLASTRTQVVFGVGSIDAELMFVGEAPGADEDAQGEPFVGAAGQLLTRMIKATGLAREQVYIANILKCRPDMPAGSSGNRKPTAEEMQTCIPYLHEQIDLIKPKVLVALGGTAMEGLLGKSGIMKLRGRWHKYRDIPLMPTYHPAYLLRNQSFTEKRKVWEDLMAVMEKIGLPISDKQRGFFLKP